MKIISHILVLLTLIFSVSAFLTTEINAPTKFSYQEVLTVNVSAVINVSGFPFLSSTGFEGTDFNITRHIINVTILNHSGSSTDAYGILDSSLILTVNATNDTSAPAMFWNFTATLTNERQWIKVNFTNVSRADDGTFGGALTAERIIQIDVKGNIINVGGFDTVNISLDTGAINTSGPLHIGGNISIKSGDGLLHICGPNNAGTWSCT